MKKIILMSLLAALTFGSGAVIAIGGKEEVLQDDEVQIVGGSYIEAKPVDSSAASVGIEKTSVPIEGMTEVEYTEAIHSFGKMTNLDDVKREIVQMTQQKIESKELRRLMGGDAPVFPFTPSYPSGIGQFDIVTNYALMTNNNLEYLKFFVEGLAEGEETTEYYQNFLADWQEGDFSELIEIHKVLLNDIAVPSEVTEAYLAADDLKLATKEQEEAYINHFFNTEDDYIPTETKVGDLF